MNKAQQILQDVVNRQIANGAPVFVNQPLSLWEIRGNDAKSQRPVTIRIRAESHYAAIKKASKTISITDCVLVSR